MKNSILTFFATLFSIYAWGQTSAVPANIRAANVFDALRGADGVATSDVLIGIPVPPGGVIGSEYLNENWMESTVMLYGNDKMLRGYPVRYDIKRNELEIKGRNGVKVLEGRLVKSFVWLDSVDRHPVYFVNAREFKNETQLDGFLEVVVDGKLALLKHTYLFIKKADYNVALDIGSRDHKILKKERFFAIRDRELKELSLSRKKLLPVFGEKSAMVEAYIKANALDIKDEAHLKKVFEYYSSL